MGITFSDGEDTWPEIQDHGPGYTDINLPGRWPGSIGPVRLRTAIRRQNRQGPGYRLPARAAMQYIERLSREGVDGRRTPRGASMTFREMYGRQPAPRYTFRSGVYGRATLGRVSVLSGIVSESLRTPLLTVFLEDY